MTCPKCNEKTRTLETRPEDDSIVRRRECVACLYRFSTIEIDMDFYKKMVQDRGKHREGVIYNG